MLVLRTAKWICSALFAKCEPETSRRRPGRVQLLRLRLEELEDRLAPATTLSIADASAPEPPEFATANMDFTVTRTGNLSAPLSVGYTTIPGTAASLLDFTPQTGTTTFAVGSATATVSIPIRGGGFYDSPSRAFSVGLTQYFPAQTYATGNEPDSLAVADFNGDGKPDLVTANNGLAPHLTDSVSVLLNTTAPGEITPSFAAQQTFAAGQFPSSVAVADFNGDGKPDIVVANRTGSLPSTVTVLLNTTAPGSSTPSFAPGQSFGTGTRSDPVAIAIADINGDGKPDLIVVNDGDRVNTVEVFLNTTLPGATIPTFAPPTAFATGNSPVSVAVGDFNGDGKPDLAVANANPSTAQYYTVNHYTVSVLLNTTVPGAPIASFAPQSTFATGNVSVSIAAGDINGDGKPDLVVTNRSIGNGTNGTVSVLINTTAVGATTPAFANQQNFFTGGLPDSVRLADFNGDGKPDLVVGESNDVLEFVNTTLAGASTASFAAPIVVSTGAGNSTVGVIVDGAGKLNFVSASFLDNSVSVLLPIPETIARATATGTITATDPPSVSFAKNVQYVNQNAGTFSMTVSLQAAETVPVSIPFTTAGTALDGTDFSGLTASPLVIPAGQTSGTITGTLIVHASLDKTLKVTLGTPVNANSDAISVDTLTIQEGLPAPVIGSVSDLEGSAGTHGRVLTPFVFQVHLPDPTPIAVTYDVFTSDGTAREGVNYVGITAGDSAHGGTVAFAAGSAFATVTVYVIAGSLRVTPATIREYFTLHIADPALSYISLASATGTINAQAAGPGRNPPVLISNVNNSEGTGGLTPFVFQIRLASPARSQVTYDVYTTDGTAKAGVNYVGITAGDAAHGGTVTFAAGSAFATVTVYVIAGSLPVTSATVRATFLVHLADPSAPDVSLASGTGTITAQNALPGGHVPAAAPRKLNVPWSRAFATLGVKVRRAELAD